MLPCLVPEILPLDAFCDVVVVGVVVVVVVAVVVGIGDSRRWMFCCWYAYTAAQCGIAYILYLLYKPGLK